MKIKYITLSFIALFLTLGTTYAQELDPTVVVNKAYEGKLIQVHKPSFEMAVPDSLTKFDLSFDYLVFEQPYKGADGFTPYVLTMKPASMVQDANTFYLNAGAGYTLHPTLDMVWTPFGGKVFQMDVYAKNRSYIGDYELLGANKGGKGYDVLSNVGVDGRFEWRSLAAGFDVAYYGLASKDLHKNRMYNALDAKLCVSSKPKVGSYFKYDVLATYRFGDDKFIREHLLGLDAELGYAFTDGHQVLFDIEGDVALYSESKAANFSLVPRYVLTRDRWGVDAGVRISNHGQIVYPDVKAYFSVIPDAMRLYALIGGGSSLNTYASLLERNHHFDPSFGVGGIAPMGISVERVSASLGLEGRIGSVFGYNLRTGYANYAGGLLDGVVYSVESDGYLPVLGYAQYQKYYATLDWRLISDSFRFDGDLTYTHAWGMNVDGLFLPPALAGDAAFEYNWNKRIYAGVDCNFATSRESSYVDAVIPWYADLGVNFEYAVNRKFSVWLRGGNLLNMSIQRNPLYAEKGVSVTAGICLNL